MHGVGKQADTVSSSDVDERARAAVKAFRAMQPGLSAYARAITHNPKVRVEVATGAPRTDGTVIFYRPPIGLGDPTRHDRFLCSKRDENGLQCCPACKIREEVLVNIYHEIDHIAFGTFIETTDRAKRDAIDKAIAEWGGKYEVQLRTKITQAPASIKSTYLGLSGLISPYLPHLFNAMEDARIECAMFQARPGTRKMFQADVLNMVRLGMPDAMNTEDRKPYRDLELNSQVTLAIYMDAVGYTGWQEYFHEKVISDSADSVIQSHVDKLRTARNAADVYYTTFPMMARLRELGYFLLPEDQPQQGDKGEQPDESGDAGESQGQDAGEAESDSSDSQGDSDNDSDSDEQGSDQASEDDSRGEGSGAESQGESSQDSDDDNSGSGDELGADSNQGDDSQPESGSDESSDRSEGSSGGSEEESQSSDSTPDQQSQEDLDADSDSVSKESGGQDSNSWPGEVSDFFGSDQAGSSEQSDEGSDETADSDESDSSSRSDQTSEQSDDSADDELSEEYNDSSEQSTDQLNDGDLDEQGRDEQGPIQDSGSASVSLDNGTTSETDDRIEEERSDQRGNRPELEELEPEGDEGLGGVKVNELEDDLPDYGSPEEMEQAFGQIHPDLQPGDSIDIHGSVEEQKAVEIAVTQGTYFEWPSTGVESIIEHTRSGDSYGWREGHDLYDVTDKELKVLGIICDTDIPESVLADATLKTRRIFDDNKVASYQRHLRSGRVNSKILGRRAWKGDDDRLFQKKRLPGKKDYAVMIEMDISSSNLNGNLALLKRSVFAQAELLSRVGVPFSIVAHSCEGIGFRSTGYTLHLHHIKGWNEPWDSDRKEAVANLVALGGNLDGHAMEYGRKQLGLIEATDKILLYYTDGKFPAANKEEELEVLLHQLKLCQRDQITLLGVGIRTDSPRRFGLDTVQVDDDSDLQRVVEHLGKRLHRSAR